MNDLVRFGVSIEEKLLDKFDALIKKKNYSSRSEALRDLVRESLIEDDWNLGQESAGTITFVYDHHHRELSAKLIDIQHDVHDLVISTQHVHLDHNNCLEIIIVRGNPTQIIELKNKIGAVKGVKQCSLTAATIGKDIS